MSLDTLGEPLTTVDGLPREMPDEIFRIKVINALESPLAEYLDTRGMNDRNVSSCPFVNRCRTSTQKQNAGEWNKR